MLVLSNHLEEFKIPAKRTEMQALKDASTDMMMLEDDDEKIPYQIELICTLSLDTQFISTCLENDG